MLNVYALNPPGRRGVKLKSRANRYGGVGLYGSDGVYPLASRSNPPRRRKARRWNMGPVGAPLSKRASKKATAAIRKQWADADVYAGGWYDQQAEKEAAAAAKRAAIGAKRKATMASRAACRAMLAPKAAKSGGRKKKGKNMPASLYSWRRAANPRRRNPKRKRRGFRIYKRSRGWARIALSARVKPSYYKRTKKQKRKRLGAALLYGKGRQLKLSNPRRRRARRNPARGRRRLSRRRNPFLYSLQGNPRRRRRASRRNPRRRASRRRRANPIRRRRKASRRNPFGRRRRSRRNPLAVGGIVAKLKQLIAPSNIIDAGWSIAGVGAVQVLPNLIPVINAYNSGPVGILVSGAVGVGASILARKFLGEKAGAAVFRGVMIAEVLKVIGLVAPGLLGFGLSGMGDWVLGGGVSGMGNWLESQVPMAGNILPPSNIAGMGMFAFDPVSPRAEAFRGAAY